MVRGMGVVTTSTQQQITLRRGDSGTTATCTNLRTTARKNTSTTTSRTNTGTRSAGGVAGLTRVINYRCLFARFHARLLRGDELPTCLACRLPLTKTITLRNSYLLTDRHTVF